MPGFSFYFFLLSVQGPPGKDGLDGPPGLPGSKVGTHRVALDRGSKSKEQRRCLVVELRDKMLPRALEQDLIEMVGFARADVTGRTRKALKVLKSI